MTISLYNTHVQICQMLDRADELWENGSAGERVMSVVSRIGARCIAFGPGVYNVVRFVWTWPRHIVKMGFIFSEGTWWESCSRLGHAVTCLAVTMVMRISVLALSILLPEVFLQKMKVHYAPLLFGLVLRAQYESFERISFGRALAGVDDQERRILLSSAAFSRISQELEGRVIDNFFQEIWLPSFVGAGILGRSFRFQGAQMHDFFSPVHISRPIFGQIKGQLVRFIAEENRWLVEQKIFTKDEIEDMTTGWAAVVNLAIFRMIDLMTLSDSGISVFGTQLSYGNVGGLYDHIELLRHLIETSRTLSLEEKGAMKYHLIADEERVTACEGRVAAYGREWKPMTAAMKDFFFAVGRFRTQFLEKNLGDISEQLQRAFVL